MKRYSTLLLTSLIALSAMSMPQNIKDALKGLGKKDGTSLVDGLKGALSGVLSTDKISVASLVGEWKYSKPAVTFKSDNLLKKAGGAAASSTITSKLAPVYKTVGFDKLTLKIAEDGSFEMKVRNITFKGTIETLEKKDSQANFTFSFQLKGKNLGKFDAYVQKGIDGHMSLTFDVSKLMTLIDKVSKISGNATLKSLSALLSGYDGLCAGFEMVK